MKNQVVHASFMSRTAAFLNGVLLLQDMSSGFRPTPNQTPLAVANRVAKALGVQVQEVSVPPEYSDKLTAHQDWGDVAEAMLTAYRQQYAPQFTIEALATK